MANIMTYTTNMLLALSLATFAVPEPRPVASIVRTDCREVAQFSGRFHLSESEPPRCLTLHGEAGTLTIHNGGPAGLHVKNSRNDITVAANSELRIVFDSATVLSVVPSASSHETDGTYQVRFDRP
jgi:hypothetical protein